MEYRRAPGTGFTDDATTWRWGIGAEDGEVIPVVAVAVTRAAEGDIPPAVRVEDKILSKTEIGQSQRMTWPSSISCSTSCP